MSVLARSMAAVVLCGAAWVYGGSPGDMEISDTALLPDDAITSAVVKVADEAFSFNMQGMDALEAGDFDGALALFEKALATLPAYTDAQNNRAVVYFRKGLISRAREMWADLVERDPNYAIGFYNLGIIEFHEKNFPQARGFFEKAAKLHKTLVEARVMLGRCRLAQGDTRAALDEFKAAYKLNPKNTGAWGFLAYGLMQTGDTAKAATILREHREHAGALELLGIIEMRRNNTAAGLELLKTAVRKGGDADLLAGAASLQLDRKDCKGALATLDGYFNSVSTPSSDAFLVAASAARECGDQTRALEFLERGIKRYPSDALMRYNLGRMYFFDKKYELADRMLGGVLDTVSDPELYYLRALCARALGDLAGAEKLARQAVGIDKKAEYIDLLGAILFARGDRQEAVRQFRKALELRPDLRSAQVNLSLAGQNTSQARAAIDAVEKELSACKSGCADIALRVSVLYYHIRDLPAAAAVLERLPPRDQNAQVVQTLGIYYRDLHQWDKAITVLEKARAARPDDPSLDADLADAYLNAGRYARGIELLLKAAPRWKGEKWRLYYQLGYAYLEQNDLDSAQRCFTRSLELKPDNPPAQGLLAFVYHRQGKTSEANRLWKKGLDKDPNNPALLVNLGLAAENQGRYQEALDYYRKAQSGASSDGSIEINIGNALAGLGRADEALKAYTRALSSPKRELAAYDAFLLEIKRNNRDKAGAMLAILAKEFSASDNARRAAAEMAASRGDTAAALATALTVRVRDPGDYALLARLYAANGNAVKARQALDSIPREGLWAEARRTLEPAVAFAAGDYARALSLWEALDDTAFATRYNMAVAHVNTREYPAALDLARDLSKRSGIDNDDRIAVLRVAAQAAVGAKDWEAGRDFNARLADLLPGDDVAAYNAAVASYNLGDIDRAWEFYQRARAIKPSLSNRDIENRYAAAKNPPVQKVDTVLRAVDSLYNEAVSLQGNGKDKAAETLYHRIVKQDPAHAQSWNNLGALLAARGALNEAEKCYLNAVKNATELPEAYANLVNLYLAREKWRQADEWIAKGLAAHPGNEMLLSLKKQAETAQQ